VVSAGFADAGSSGSGAVFTLLHRPHLDSPFCGNGGSWEPFLGLNCFIINAVLMARAVAFDVGDRVFLFAIVWTCHFPSSVLDKEL